MNASDNNEYLMYLLPLEVTDHLTFGRMGISGAESEIEKWGSELTNIEFIEEEPIKTKVSINADVKISLKYSMLSPIISRLYKGIITGLIYKMTNSILRNDVT